MHPHPPLLRPAVRGLALALLAASLGGCAWFRGEPAYLAAVEGRPLEVPPDLVLPSSAGALQIPPTAAVAASPGELPPRVVDGAVGGFHLDDSSEGAFRRVGIALGRVEGVDSSTAVPALNAYEVRYRGEEMLLRLRPQDGRVQVDAIGADGRPLDTPAARGLLEALRQRLL
ncbi:MAG: hypothetical protein KGZ52_07680 [Xanthomonadaceae bacterium]|jgi:hypothetical protein|nr:hypothetical protein [Xanthomonadaceae bacterium]MBS3959262.1 hypothetical protein [Xanthomonadaceae bacterium]